MKKLISTSLFILLLTFTIQSCNSANNESLSKIENKEIASQLKGTWILSSIDGTIATNVFKGSIPTINFDLANHKVNGDSGCNQYNGGFVLIGNIFTPTPMVSTLMACPEANQEGKYIELLGKKSTLVFNNKNLEFVQNGKTVLVFSPKTK